MIDPRHPQNYPDDVWAIPGDDELSAEEREELACTKADDEFDDEHERLAARGEW